MPEWTIYTLHPRGALHIGERGVGQEETACRVPADTLFAALVTVWIDAGGQEEGWGRAFAPAEEAVNPPFLLTSAFPFAGGVRFYPLPQADLASLGVEADERRKDLRQIEFVSEGIFRRIVTGQSLAGCLPPAEGDPELGCFMQGKALWLTAEEVASLPEAMRLREDRKAGRPLRALEQVHVWRRTKVPRVAVDRIGSASTLFHTGRLTFAPDCGLWFGVDWRRPAAALGDGLSWRGAFERALSLLGDSGLGGERSVGYGAFQWARGEQVAWDSPAPGALYVTLSRYHPRPSETPGALVADPVSYTLVSVAGYLETPTGAAQRRRRLWLAAEGSVLRAVGAGPYGDVTDVRPRVGDFPHPVWRYGLACPVAVREVRRA